MSATTYVIPHSVDGPSPSSPSRSRRGWTPTTGSDSTVRSRSGGPGCPAAGRATTSPRCRRHRGPRPIGCERHRPGRRPGRRQTLPVSRRPADRRPRFRRRRRRRSRVALRLRAHSPPLQHTDGLRSTPNGTDPRRELRNPAFAVLLLGTFKAKHPHSPEGGDTMAGVIASELAAAGFTDAVEIGRGGGGVVYRCYQQSLARSVAIKVLASDLDEDDRERFLREGYAMGALSGHPNIVNILQVGVTDGNRPFIVMPFHAMGSLAERVRREGRIAWPDALRIGVKLCGALETAHRTGTLHRDIKPANVLVNDYGEPQLSDFGTARIAGGYKTVTGFFTGTLSYTAPEVLAGKPPTVAADVYSLGATLYALIAGRPPHERKTDEDLIAHYLRITSTPVPDLRDARHPGRRLRGDREGDVARAGRTVCVRGGLRPRIAAGAAAQRLDGRCDGAQRARRHPEKPEGTQAIPMSGLAEPSEPAGPSSRVSSGDTASPPTRPVGRSGTRSACSRTPRRSASRACPGRFRRHAPDAADRATEEAGPQDDPDHLAAAVAVVLLVIGGVFVVTSTRDTDGAPHRAPAHPTAEAAARLAADRGCAGRPRRGGRHPGRRHHLGVRRHGGRQPRQRRARGLRPRDRQLEERRGPARSRAARDGGDVAGHTRSCSAAGAPRAPTRGSRPTRSGGSSTAAGRNCRRLLQPRAAAAAAVVGDRIVVTGGVDADGQAAEHHRGLRRHVMEARRPHPDSAADAGGGVGRQAGVRARRHRTGPPTWRRSRRTTRPPTRGRPCPNFPSRRSDFGVASHRRSTGGGGRHIRGPGPQERGRIRSRDGDVDRSAGHGHCAPRHGGRGGRASRVYAIGGSTGCGRRQDHVVGRSAEAGTAQTAARTRNGDPCRMRRPRG